MNKYDLTIIGAGPGGYEAALYASQSGLKVCLVEKNKIGGVCLNEGCIPTKTMLTSARALHQAQNSSHLGVKAEEISFDLSQAKKRMGEVTARLRGGVEFLLKSRKVDVKIGEALFSGRKTAIVNGETIESENIIIATGAETKELPFLKIDDKTVLSHWGVLELDHVPESMMVIGGGVIGCELASIYNRLGAKATIVEMLDNILPGVDDEAAKRLEVLLKRQGIAIRTGEKITGADVSPAHAVVKFESGEDLKAEKVLLSIGRKPVFKALALDKAGVSFSDNGIITDAFMMTSNPNVYAIGDCTGKYMLAHVASYEGMVAVDNILGKKVQADYSAVPYCVFTDPELASCGVTEAKAVREKLDVKISKFNMRALGKAHAADRIEGMIKFVIDKKSEKVLGIDIIGECASDMIEEAAVIIRNGLTIEDILKTIHAHPTFAEIFLENAHMARGKPIHSL